MVDWFGGGNQHRSIVVHPANNQLVCAHEVQKLSLLPFELT